MQCYNDSVTNPGGDHDPNPTACSRRCRRPDGRPSTAVTVKNTSSTEVTVGVDWGSKEKIETIPAGKSVSFDCKDGCGVTGPWGFSWQAAGKDEITTDGTALVTVMDGKSPER
jgi:hypothetical protein